MPAFALLEVSHGRLIHHADEPGLQLTVINDGASGDAPMIGLDLQTLQPGQFAKLQISFNPRHRGQKLAAVAVTRAEDSTCSIVVEGSCWIDAEVENDQLQLTLNDAKGLNHGTFELSGPDEIDADAAELADAIDSGRIL